MGRVVATIVGIEGGTVSMGGTDMKLGRGRLVMYHEGSPKPAKRSEVTYQRRACPCLQLFVGEGRKRIVLRNARAVEQRGGSRWILVGPSRWPGEDWYKLEGCEVCS